MTWRGAFTGALMLIALEAVVRSDASANRLGSALTTIGDLTRLAMSPAVPAIPYTSGTAAKKFGKSTDNPIDPFD